MMTVRILKPSKQSFSINHPPDSDLRRLAADRVVNLRYANQLDHPEPVANVAEHEDEVVVVLERLDLHRRHLGQVLNGILDAGQGGEVLLGEPGEPDVVADGLQLLQDGEQLALVRLRQLGKVVVGNHVRQLLGLAPVLLLVHRHLGNPHQEGCLKAPMTAHNQTGTGRNRDRRPPPVPLDNGSYRGDLGCAVPVGVFRVRLAIVRSAVLV